MKGKRGKEDRMHVHWRKTCDSPHFRTLIKPDRADILDRLTKKLREEEDSEVEEHHAIKRMQEMGVKRGMGRRCTLAGKERKLYNHLTTGTVSMNSLRMALGRGTEHLWSCPQCNEVVAPTKV